MTACVTDYVHGATDQGSAVVYDNKAHVIPRLPADRGFAG
jgi:hypothetical protein